MKNMNFIIRILFIGVLTISFYSCDKEGDSYDVSKETNLPAFDYEEQVLIASGGSFTPVATAKEGDTDLNITVAEGFVDMESPGEYTVTYLTENSDGFKVTADQTVIVYDIDVNTNDISGTYSGDVLRNGSIGYTENPVTLTKLEGYEGIYGISDWIAGFYHVGYEYGPAYQFSGYIQINASNEVILLYMTNVWGDPFDNVIGSYDPNTQTISYTANWLDGTYAFEVELTKN